MTYEEAIEILKHEHDYAQLLSYVNEALKTAISALEKQTPRKPLCESLADRFCPVCGAYINFDALNEKIEEAPEYCSNCGQKMSWEE